MKVEVKVPAVGESITEVTIYKWLKQSGDFVDADEIICEVETDKATLELTSEKSGELTCKVEEGATCSIGDIIAVVDTEKQGKKAAAPASDDKKDETASASEKHTNKVVAHPSPAAKKILDEKGVAAADVKGTGKDGRITKEDALMATQKVVTNIQKPKPESQPQPTSTTTQSTERGTRREKMTTLRKTIAKKLLAAKHETAMLTTFNEVDMTNVIAARKQYKEIFKEKYGVGLGFMSFFTKAAAIAMKEFPAVNASIDGEYIVYHDYVDMGVAVSTPKGLVVPVVRNLESLGFHEVESEIIRLAKKARDGKISIAEMTGGTFTVTNGGVFGSMMSTPLINYPQAAILGMHNIVERPMGVDGQIVLRPCMYIALSYDHRIIDGRESVGFLRTVKELIENPIRMMLEV
ncbi:2-oxoglutarate dehydrogenase complex dihydrolipoyllysine-residue succinyltransferase [Candidatus Uabimicrobium amorphum]|uniref:Dihydrolipoyllysine-residue succinyltransferase component of 2-oxoglutarate dehydrogenase complex n=1 Tax=Uabimicrobium amorphum TaxID=2596890 RepID=A0A5S9F701_UABAM|nr:2-oxoglutarate dehydrogenase complex dihydrolipoyllysine-residue succinyltransferase [Candidatus Uabimicrobium amorphum]BBM86742.1 dihydrolipoyllysine-residue succinyltransferasecomponent of 2-oxoglutarate dehydrogenase complex [Candidatus Uabimicrobium amorphum]